MPLCLCLDSTFKSSEEAETGWDQTSQHIDQAAMSMLPSPPFSM